MDVNQSPRILITRLSAIGDCILTLPMLTTLRKAIPNAFVVWAVESPTHKLLELHPGIDEIVVVPKGWMKKPKLWKELRSKLRDFNFDVVLDPQGITKSAVLGYLSGAKRRIGLKGKWGRELSRWLNNELVDTASPHIVKRSVQLLEPLGVTNVDLETLTRDLPVCPASQRSVRTGLESLGVSDRYAVLNPGGAWASKRWELDRFGAVASYLKRHHNLTSVVVWAGDEEREMAQAVFDFDPTASVIAPPTSLTELAALASEAQFFIGGDTGPLHIASAMGCPCIGLYGTTNAVESGAYGPYHIEIQKWYQSGSCRKRRNADNDAMRDILAGDVFSACDQMLNSLATKSAA